jgi:hypothetical protein
MRLAAWLETFIAEWRGIERIASEKLGDESKAVLIRNVLDSLESQARQSEEQLLSGRQAAELCGYSRDHLRRLVKQGVLRDFGRKGAPRYRKSDLPRKVGASENGLRDSALTLTVTPTRKQIARDVVDRHSGGA